MLITFRCKAAASITMFGDVAVKLLEMMGQSGTAPGAIQGDDVARALANLRAAIGPPPPPPPVAPAPDADRGAEAPVALYRRALPLIDLLERAVKAKADVVWEKG